MPAKRYVLSFCRNLCTFICVYLKPFYLWTPEFADASLSLSLSSPLLIIPFLLLRVLSPSFPGLPANTRAYP